jgi:hypothetical protein
MKGLRLMSLVALVILSGAELLLAADGKSVLLIAQSHDNHPPATHEYLPGLARLAELLKPTEGLTVRVVNGDEPWTEGPRLLSDVDGAVLFLAEGARWCQADPRRHEALSQLAARRGGLVALHWAIGTRAIEPIAPFLKLLGGCHGGPDRKYTVVETNLHVVDSAHPIVAGLQDLRVRDEFYYRLKFVEPPEGIRPLVQATIDGRAETVAWAYQRPDGGRSFGFSGLHFDDNWQHAEYRTLIKQAVLWTLQLPVK